MNQYKNLPFLKKYAKIKKMRKKQLRLIFFILPIIILIIGGWLFFSQKDSYFKEFSNTKQKIQNLIQQINLLASQSNYQFQLIESKQKDNDIKNALELVIEEKERNREINETALKLTEELKQLTKLLPKFPNKDERDKIEKAIQYQIAAVSHLLNYGSGVDIILQELAQKYEAILDKKNFEIKRDLSQLINLIRQEIAAANENNQKFIQILGEIHPAK